jgi:hypothetical protein
LDIAEVKIRYCQSGGVAVAREATEGGTLCDIQNTTIGD